MGCQLAQRLAHQTRLQTGQGIAHFAFEFGLWRQCRNRVHHNQVHRARAHQAVHNLQCLLAGVGLADQQILQIHAQVLRVLNVKRVLGVDEGALTAYFLHLGNHLQRERGFARRLRAINFNHPATRQAADAQGNVQTERAG